MFVRRYVDRDGVIRNDGPVSDDGVFRFVVVATAAASVARFLVSVPEEKFWPVRRRDRGERPERVYGLGSGGLSRVTSERESERIGSRMDPAMSAAGRSGLKGSGRTFGAFDGRRIGDSFRSRSVDRTFPFSGIVTRRKNEIGFGSGATMTARSLGSHRDRGPHANLLRWSHKAVKRIFNTITQYSGSCVITTNAQYS